MPLESRHKQSSVSRVENHSYLLRGCFAVLIPGGVSPEPCFCISLELLRVGSHRPSWDLLLKEQHCTRSSNSLCGFLFYNAWMVIVSTAGITLIDRGRLPPCLNLFFQSSPPHGSLCSQGCQFAFIIDKGFLSWSQTCKSATGTVSVDLGSYLHAPICSELWLPSIWLGIVSAQSTRSQSVHCLSPAPEHWCHWCYTWSETVCVHWGCCACLSWAVWIIERGRGGRTNSHIPMTTPPFSFCSQCYSNEAKLDR